MNEKPLVKQDDTEIVAWYCGKCGIVTDTEGKAAQCCKPYACSHCGRKTPRYRLICSSCSHDIRNKKERERFEKAEKILAADYGEEPVFYDDACVMGGIESVIESCEDDGIDPPRYVWATSSRYFKLDLDDLLESALERFQEDADERYYTEHDLVGIDALRAAVAVFNEQQGGLRLYFEDGRAVDLGEPEKK